MFKRFRLRNLLMKYPALDGMRLSFLAWFCNHGTEFYGRTYRILRFYAPGSQAYLNKALSNNSATGKKNDCPVIFALYHGRMVGLLGLKPREKLTILISQSRDGEIIARACIELGFSIARGSNSRGGFQGAREIIDAAEHGQNIAFMVDGPRGPVQDVKSGVIRLAEITGLPIIPFVCRSRTSHWMWGWDKFMAPFWGTPIVYLFGEPILVPKEITTEQREELRLNLDSHLRSLKDKGDTLIEAVK